LQNIDDPHTHEYVQRLQDEQGFLDLTESVQAYYQRLKDPKRAARAAFRRLEHLYYKSDKGISLPTLPPSYSLSIFSPLKFKTEAAALAKAAATKSAQQPEQPNEQANDQPNGQPEQNGTPSGTDNNTPSTTAEPTASSPSSALASDTPSGPSPHSQLIHDLAVIVYAHGDERLRARTMLMHIFHHALHDRYNFFGPFRLFL
jgi:translation initiation factor 3 subunit C